ncbi:MAG: hypothetical protein ACRDH2_05555 [Anaerolineales bacterium]
MNTRTVSRWLAAPLALSLAILACGGGGVEPTATPFVRPTQRATATEAAATEAVAPTEEVAPTQEPEPTQGGQSNVSLVLSDEPYSHSSGAFAITLPKDWEVEERDNSVFVNGPDGVAAIEVSFTNVGTSFDEETLDAYIEAVETNWFGTFPNYEQTSREPQSDGSIGVFKTLDLSDGTPQTVSSYYWQEGTVIYEEDFWVNSDQYDAYVDGLLEVINSLQTDPDAAAQVDPYAIVYSFSSPKEFFEFDVPYGWTYSSDTSDDGTTTIDTFTSPDGVTLVESITYDDGEAVSRSNAGAFALALLKEVYNYNDIKVSGDEIQPDGSERLTWSSASNQVDGVSFFETRGTTFLMLTWVVDQDYTALYLPVWENLLNTYTVP